MLPIWQLLGLRSSATKFASRKAVALRNAVEKELVSAKPTAVATSVTKLPDRSSLARAMRRSHVITVRGYAKGLFERASKMIRTQIDQQSHIVSQMFLNEDFFCCQPLNPPRTEETTGRAERISSFTRPGSALRVQLAS